VLILSADVGEGHAAAARALKQQLELQGEPVEATIIDGLAAMGERLRSLVEDGYRTQLRVSPRSYSVYYWMLEHLAFVRLLTRLFLCRLGGTALRRAILAHDPDVVVSTYPAITVVLSHLRRRRLLDAPAVATITDMTGLFFWAQRGIDTHLVMYEESVRDVERIAGRGSAQIVRPLISAEFLKRRERGAARAALGLPAAGRVVVVSGGGWGVGDLEGAVEQLVEIPDATVVCLAGRNDAQYEHLSARFAAIERVRVLGFTDRMPDLLAAADVLVHSTGGVTCLEAMAAGCPIVSYGLPVGHAKLNTRKMAEHEFLLLAEDPGELVERVEHGCAGRAPRRQASHGVVLDAASAVLAAPRRVSQIARWRLRAVGVGVAALLSLCGGAWMMSTDEVAAFASVVGIHPVKTVKTIYPAAGVIVYAPAGETQAVAARLRRDALVASIATTVVPGTAVRHLLRADGDTLIPTLRHAGLFGWIGTPAQLRREARALHLHHHFYYLEPQSPSLGQLLLARTAGGLPVKGSVVLDAAQAGLPMRPLRQGEIVVVSLGSTAATLHAIDRLAHTLQADGLVGLPLSALLD